jgi:hypothetical protein
MNAHSIDDIIHDLTTIIDDCRQRNSRLGYFPAMYRKVTIRIKDGIRERRFDDNGRMEHLDIIFAERYTDAYWQWRKGQQPTQAWAYAFARAQETQHTVLQHLILGMNAHINLDLGIAAAQTCHDCDLAPLRNDFFAINDILSGLLDEVQDNLNQSSSFFRRIDALGGRADEAFGNFSLRRARQSAWQKAETLHKLSPAQYPPAIRQFDQATNRLARIICPTAALPQAFSAALSRVETAEPREIIEALADTPPQILPQET